MYSVLDGFGALDGIKSAAMDLWPVAAGAGLSIAVAEGLDYFAGVNGTLTKQEVISDWKLAFGAAGSIVAGLIYWKVTGDVDKAVAMGVGGALASAVIAGNSYIQSQKAGSATFAPAAGAGDVKGLGRYVVGRPQPVLAGRYVIGKGQPLFAGMPSEIVNPSVMA